MTVKNHKHLNNKANAKKPATKNSQPKKRPAQKVAHAQLFSQSQKHVVAAEQRYKELCRSIPKHGEKCVRYGNALMADLWTMAEEVYELKAVCRSLGKPYEVDAIKLCGGETAFHYLRDLYTAFGGKKQKALECGKAPYTLLREFRKERAEKNKEKKGEFGRTKANGDDAAEGGNAAENGGKQKSAAKKAKATKTLAKDAEDSTNDDDEQEEAYEEVGQDEDHEDFDSGLLFDEVAKRNGWDLQRQLQAMVDFYSPSEALSALLLDLDDDAADFKDFLAEQEKLPPPKEPNSPLSVLVMLRNRLGFLVEDIKAVDWKKESSDDYRKLLDTIRERVEQIGKGVPQ